MGFLAGGLTSFVVAQLEAAEFLVVQHVRVCVVALLFYASARLLGGFPDAVQLLALAGSEVLSALVGVRAGGAGVEVVLFVLAVDALLEVRQPAVDLLLGLGEAALDVAPDLRQVVVEEAVLAVFLAVAGALLVRVLVGALVVARLLRLVLVVVVLGQSAGVHLIGFELALRLLLLLLTLRGARRLGRSGFFWLEVRVGHAEEGIEGRLDLATAGCEYGFDDFGVDGGERFDQRVLGLLLGALRARRLGRRDLFALLLEGHAGLGRGRLLDGLVGGFVAVRADSPSLLLVVVVVEVHLLASRD